MGYPISVNLMPGLPQEPYDNGHYIGVVAHATADYGDTPDAERNYEAGHWQDAFVHFFVGAGRILQVASTDYVCYGAGHTANHLGYAQVELCQTTDAKQFAEDYAMYTWLLAKLLHDRKLGVVDGVTLMSHAQVSAKWHECDHMDPIEYLASHGKAWANVVADVTAIYKRMEGGETVKEVVVYFSPGDFSTALAVANARGGIAMFCRNGKPGVHPDALAAEVKYNIGGPALGCPGEVYMSGAHALDTMAAVVKEHTAGKF